MVAARRDHRGRALLRHPPCHSRRRAQRVDRACGRRVCRGAHGGCRATTRPAERELPLVVSVRPEATQVVDFTNRELGFCAALHAHELGHGFFASLGHGFLRAYYATFVASPYAVALLATSQGAPVGLVVGAIDPRAHARWVLRRRGLRLAARGAAVLVVRPRVAWRFLRTRVERYRARWRSERGGPEAA